MMKKRIATGFHIDDLIISRKEDRRTKLKRRITASFIAVILFMLVFMILFIKNRKMPEVILKVKSASILQDEEVPAMKVSAVCDDKRGKKKVLEDGYTVGEFVKDLNKGKGYELEYEIDQTKEGKYPIKITMEKKLEKKIHEKWGKKLKFQTQNGTLKVKNKFGTWDGNKFKKLDGSYATSSFIVSNGNEYYFDENGEMVTGEQIINFDKCVFDEKGVLLSKERYVDVSKPMVALTFDDGPGEYTEALLQKLEENHSVATFFMQGKNVGNYPNALKKMEEMGCEMGNHSWSHPKLTKLDEAGIRMQIESTNQAIAAVVGHGATMLRPPYGAFNPTVRSLAGIPVMLWSMDTLDWKRKDAAAIRDYVLSNVSDGDIILLHDIHSFSVEAAFELIPKLKEMGYQLVTISEMAKAKGVEMIPGEKYTRLY